MIDMSNVTCITRGMNNNNNLHIVSAPTCFNASASSSGSINLELCWSYKIIKVYNSIKAVQFSSVYSVPSNPLQVQRNNGYRTCHYNIY
jgi:adenosine/AMP kinase